MYGTQKNPSIGFRFFIEGSDESYFWFVCDLVVGSDDDEAVVGVLLQCSLSFDDGPEESSIVVFFIVMIPLWLFDVNDVCSFFFHVVELLFSDDVCNGTLVVFCVFILVESDVDMSGALISVVSAQVFGLHFVFFFFFCWIKFLVLSSSGIFFLSFGFGLVRCSWCWTVHGAVMMMVVWDE